MAERDGIMRRIFFKGLKFLSLLCVYAHRFTTFLDSFSLLRILFSVLVDVFSVDPSLAAVKMRQIDLSQAAFGIIYRFLGGFPHAFTGPKSPQLSPEEGF
jgi:hypothetical protein